MHTDLAVKAASAIEIKSCKLHMRKVSAFILLYLVETGNCGLNPIYKNKVSEAGQNQILHLNCIAIVKGQCYF